MYLAGCANKKRKEKKRKKKKRKRCMLCLATMVVVINSYYIVDAEGKAPAKEIGTLKCSFWWGAKITTIRNRILLQ